MLIDLIQYAREITNIDPKDTANRDLLVRYINRAAQELYDSYDLPGSIWEREFRLSNLENRLITVPWYVGLIKGVRRYAFGRKIQLVDPRPRYHYKPWRQNQYQWRIMGDTALSQHMTQSGRIKLVLAEPEDNPVKVTVKGQTTTAQQSREEVIFESGQTERSTQKQWSKARPFGIISLTKSARTHGDITVYQEVDDREIALIPNCFLYARNRVVQIHDGFHDLTFGDQDHIEVLFKWQWVPLFYDEDQFLGSDNFDQAIIWKLREHWHSTRAGEEQHSLLANAKARDLIQQLAFTAESEVEKMVLDAENPYEFAPLGGRGFGFALSVPESTTTTDEDDDEDMRVLAIQGIEELRRVTGYTDNQLLMLEFAYTKSPPDGQGGEFVYLAEDMRDDDGIDVVKPNNKPTASPGRWIRQINLT